jgi:hypothetical protein
VGRNKKTMAFFKRMVTEDESWVHYFELDCSHWKQNTMNLQNQRNSQPTTSLQAKTDLGIRILRGLHSSSAKGQTRALYKKKVTQPAAASNAIQKTRLLEKISKCCMTTFNTPPPCTKIRPLIMFEVSEPQLGPMAKRLKHERI